MSPIATAVAASAFWIFIAVIVVAGVMAGALRHRETQRTIREAIERGQTLDPEVLERLIRSDKPPPPSRGVVAAGGIILLALGGGMAMIGVFGAQTNPAMLSQGLGVASLLGLLGLALILISMMMPRGKGRG
jgi:hypothetical protein